MLTINNKRRGIFWGVLFLSPLLTGSAVGKTGALPAHYDLLVRNANVLDVASGKTALRDVYISEGKFKRITPVKLLAEVTAETEVHADGRLMVPGFFDMHHHLDLALDPQVEVVSQKQLVEIQQQLARLYLSHGVTTVCSAGGKEVNLPVLRTWRNGAHIYPDFYPSGSALVTINTMFYNHVYLDSQNDIVQRVQRYHAAGIRDLKLYNLMDKTSMATALGTAHALNMRVTGHIDGEMVTIQQAVSHGLRQLEHIKTLFTNIFRVHQTEFNGATLPPDDQQNWLRREFEIFRLVGADNERIAQLLQLLSEKHVAITPTLSIYAQAVGMLPTAPSNQDVFTSYGVEGHELARAREGYEQLLQLTKMLHDAGIRLHTGSDNLQPGLTILNEMYQLQMAGISMQDVFRIASLNGALTLELDGQSGSIAREKSADFVLFDKDPLKTPGALFSSKRVYKQGRVFLY